MKTALFILLQLAASGADAYYTNRNAMTPLFREHNPIARPFMGTRASRIDYFSITAAGKIAVFTLLRKRHSRTADGIAVAGISDNAFAAAFSATHLTH
jgi:hypothetical protein